MLNLRNSLRLSLCALVLAVLGFFAIQETRMVLDYKDVVGFHVSEIRSFPGVSLHMSGLVFHSALGIESVETRVDDDCLVVLVHLVLVHGKLTGNLSYDVDVPTEVNSVCFGPTKHVIWERGSSELIK